MTAKPIVAMSVAFTLLTGCGAPTPQTAFNPRSDYAVEGVLIWAAIRYRRRGNDQLPPQIHGNIIDAQVDTANELHLPVGRTVNLILHSNDGTHSFWIPALGGKRDAVPGQCYQLCGYSHANMRERADDRAGCHRLAGGGRRARGPNDRLRRVVVSEPRDRKPGRSPFDRLPTADSDPQSASFTR